ncbi:DUF6443 domain-containing protein [Chryseolinea lacunae]|uniref:DUF6443 domain-containing protein n=1 Tax=Chryseolinea lacunae TaxID=2801331 RepID=A0ABS1L1L0_9BACT|nr:DUF6443 domain-containing protein [Chryseolinea lacunae]MBL0745584.1 hypothetical protein [Chryseolinea lacunae]
MKSLYISFMLVLVCSLPVAAQTLSSVSNTCAGNWVSLYVGGGGSNCTGVVVPNASWWHFYPEPTEKEFGSGYNSVNVRWSSAVADVQVYAGYQCMQQATTGTTNTVHFSILASVAAPTPTVNIAETQICEDGYINFSATCPNPGPNPSYSYYLDNSPTPFYSVSTTGTQNNVPQYNSAGNLASGWHTVYVKVNNYTGCASPSAGNSPTKSFYITPKTIVAANWTDDGEICAATHPNLNAHISVQTTVSNLSYRWLYLGSYGQTTTDPNHVYVNPTDNADIGVQVMSDQWCTDLPKVFPPNLAYVNVAQSTAPTLDIVIPANKYTYCPGESITVRSSQVGTSYTWKIGSTTLSQTTQTITIPVTDNASSAQEYSAGEVISLHVTGINSNGGCLSTNQADATSTPLNIVVNPLPNVVTTPAGTARVCTGCTKTVALTTPGPTGTTYQWYRNNVAITSAEPGWNTASFSTKTLASYKVTVTKLCTTTSAVVTLIANTPPMVSAGGNQSIALPTTTLMLNGAANDPDTDGTITGMAWTKIVGPAATLATANTNLNTRNATSKLTLTNLVIGYYLFRLTGTDNTGETVTSDAEVIVYPKNNYNYVRTQTLLTPTPNPANVTALPVGSRTETTEYVDGLGRPLQSVVTQGSMNNKRDIVTPYAYDQFGREALEYMPYVAVDNSGDLKADALGPTYTTSPQYNFYNTTGTDKVVDDNRPFSMIKFEPSPLGRVDKEYGPGKAWAPLNSGGSNKFVKYSYLTNVHGTGNNTTDEKVIAWKVYRSGKIARHQVNAGSIEVGGYYSTNQLTVAVKVDEEGNMTREYSDKQGQIVLRKSQLQGGAGAYLNNLQQWNSTYFLYDDFGDLRYIFQPELSLQVYSSDTYIPSETEIRKFAFRYVFDSRHRVIEKWSPGAEPVYITYDPRDRVVMTQDGVQRAKSPREWSVIKYDNQDRPIITATLPDPYGWTPAFVQTYINSFYNNLAAGKAWYEERGTDMHGYTNKSYPDQLLPTECLTVVYYDDYGFKTSLRKPSDYAYQPAEITGMPSTAQSLVKGYMTGIKVRVLDGEAFGELQWLSSCFYYDDQYEVIQSVIDNYKGGKDRFSSLYDFVKLTKSKSNHESKAISWKNLVNASVEGNKIVKRGGAANTWDASAVSNESLPANTNGFLEISASEEWNYRMFGLGTTNPNGNPALVNYGLILQGGGNLVKAEAGIYTAVGTYCSGDTLRIERIGNQITYKKNGVALAPSTTGSTTSLNAVAVLYSGTASIAYAKASFSTKSIAINYETEYDHFLHETNQWHQVGSNPKILISRTNYNEIGQPVEKRLHSTNATASDARETIDYQYNIRGWLQSINDPQTNPKLFAMSLKYFDPSANGGDKKYNGAITEAIWKTGGGNLQSYGYFYDTLGRLKDARYFNLDVAAQNGRFTETIGGKNLKGYDRNGNILKLKRYGRTTGSAYGLMDDLTYSYTGNLLTRVDDAVAMNAQELGFKELTKVANEYTYDGNGNMVTDLNKGLANGATAGIVYQSMDQPRLIYKGTNNTITNVYDATGRKLFVQVTTPQKTTRTDYVSEFVYQNDTLKFATHPEGRVMLTAATPEYQYNLKDHLDNVRATFTTNVALDTAVATLENSRLGWEQSKFLRIANARRVQSSLFDHTNGTATGYAERLNGSANEKYGIARSLSVMPGDQISMEVYAKYVDTNSGNRTAALNTLLTQIAAGTAPVGTVVDGGGYATSTSSFPFAGLLNTTGSTGGPKAYLNYLVFDRSYNFVTGGFKRLSATPKETGNDVSHERLYFDNILIKQAGYIYIYLSNEEATPIEVFFDDMKVTQTVSPIIQQDDYYPFGLTFNDYSREKSFPQKLLFEEKQFIDDLDVDFYDFEWRQYDAVLGRTTTQDPHAEFYFDQSPYSFLGNDPINTIDPSGMDTVKVHDIDPKTFSNENDVVLLDEISVSPSDGSGDGQGDESNGEKEDEGGGRVEDNFSPTEKFLVKVNEWNPLACGYNALLGVITGKDRFGNEMSGTDIAWETVSAIPGFGPEAKGGSKVLRFFGKYNDHHSWMKFLGGAVNQKLTRMSAAAHKKLHRKLNEFLKQFKAPNGKTMSPGPGNSGQRIRRNFSEEQIIKALSKFYRTVGKEFKKAAKDFFDQVNERNKKKEND